MPSSSGTVAVSLSQAMSRAIDARQSCWTSRASITWANAAGEVNPSRRSRQKAMSSFAPPSAVRTRLFQSARARATCRAASARSPPLRRGTSLTS